MISLITDIASFIALSEIQTAVHHRMASHGIRQQCQKDGNEHHTTCAHFLSCHILCRVSRRLRFYLFFLHCILHVCNQNNCPADARHQTEQSLVSAHGHCKRCAAIRTSRILDFFLFGIDPGMCNILSIQRI